MILKKLIHNILVFICFLLTGLNYAEAQTREQKVREDKKRIEASGYWYYNDLEKGIKQAAAENKPLMVVLRCLPCEECVKLDDELVESDPRVKPLLDQFVRVRIVGTNGLDLSLFQFDYDQSFAVFFLNADKTIYCRYGTRSHRTNWSDDVSIEGLGKAMEGVLELHKQFPSNRDLLKAKTGFRPLFPTPEQFPLLKDKYSSRIEYEGKVVQSCIHCHQIGDAIRQETRRNMKNGFPDEVLFPYPHPKTFGIIIDPSSSGIIKEIVASSLADKAGFKKSDKILRMNSQPILSIADVQWVLNSISGRGGKVDFLLQRGKENIALSMELENGWRVQEDISWRVSTWGLRRMVLGGMVLENIPQEEKVKQAGQKNETQLRVKHVGQFGPHAAAKNAGFQQGDFVLSFDGKSDFQNESELIRYALQNKKVGDRVPVKVIRNSKALDLQLPIQE